MRYEANSGSAESPTCLQAGNRQKFWLVSTTGTTYYTATAHTDRISHSTVLETPECDVLCVNCAMSFYDLELFFKAVSEGYGEERPLVFCFA